MLSIVNNIVKIETLKFPVTVALCNDSPMLIYRTYERIKSCSFVLYNPRLTKYMYIIRKPKAAPYCSTSVCVRHWCLCMWKEQE